MRAHGRARVSTNSPQAFAICDNCGFLYNHIDLSWQMEWAGNRLINTKQLICSTCNDDPNQQLRAIIIPADPQPIMNPRIQDYATAVSDYRSTSGQNTIDPTTGLTIPGQQIRVTTLNSAEGGARVVQVVGESSRGSSHQPGTDANAIMPLEGNVHYGTPISVLSMVTDGVTGTVVTVTCSSAHGLSTNSQIAVRGTSPVMSSGFFSVTVTSAIAFTYTLPFAMATNTSVLTGGTLVQTALVNLPYGFDQIPQTGRLR